MKDFSQFATRGYFAAANGYAGFRSYFDGIFAPERFARIFVLKGGPGTGKSTLMQKFASHFFEKGCEVDAILCSSDSDSLDGVILGGKRKIAILDGTAPHTRDTLLPGAVDELVDLGCAWNSAYLAARRGEIAALQAQKKDRYQNAYENLNIAGHIYLKAQRGIKSRFDTRRAREVARQLIDTATQSEHSDTRLFEAFGKNGMERMGGFERTTPIFVRGDFESASLFFSVLARELARRGMLHIRYPSPLLDSKTDGILLGEQLYLASEDVGEVDAEEFLQPLSDGERAEHAALLSLHDRFTKRAAEAFFAASTQHFALEQIYRGAMDYSRLDGILERLIQKAERELE